MDTGTFEPRQAALPGQPPFLRLERPALQELIHTGSEEVALIFLSQGLLSLNLRKGSKNANGSIYVLAKDVLIIPPREELLVSSMFKETNLYLLRLHHTRMEQALAQRDIPHFFDRERSQADALLTARYRLYDHPRGRVLYDSLELLVNDLLHFPGEQTNLILLDLFRFLVYLHDFPDGTFRPLATVDAMDKVLWTLKFIRENYAVAALSDVARQLHYRPDYLSALLKKATGKSFSELLRKRRMIVASDLLGRTNLSLQEIALKTGFQDYSGFYRAFQQEFGIGPREYRQTMY